MCDDLAPERKRKKKKTLIRLLAQRAETEIRFLDITGICNTMVNNNGVGREVRVKEPMFAIDKLIPSPLRTLLEAVYGLCRAKVARFVVTW